MKKLAEHTKIQVNLPNKLITWLDEKSEGEKTRNQFIKDILLEKMKAEEEKR